MLTLHSQEHMERFSSAVEYLNSNDTTIMGSRNGQASLAMWYALQKKFGAEGLQRDASHCYENAMYLHNLFHTNGVSTMLNTYACAVLGACTRVAIEQLAAERDQSSLQC